MCTDNVRCGGYAVTLGDQPECYWCDDTTDYQRTDCVAEYAQRTQMTEHKPCNSRVECLICGNATNMATLLGSRATTTAGYLSQSCTHLVEGGTHTLDLDLHAAPTIAIHGGSGTLDGNIVASTQLDVDRLVLTGFIAFTGTRLAAHDVTSRSKSAVVITNTHLSATLTHVAGTTAAVAIGHATGKISVTCPPRAAAPYKVVVQQKRLSKAVDVKVVNCREVDLGKLLDVYGDAYELEYLNPEHVKRVDYYLELVVQILLYANLVMFTAALLVYDEFTTYMWNVYTHR